MTVVNSIYRDKDMYNNSSLNREERERGG